MGKLSDLARRVTARPEYAELYEERKRLLKKQDALTLQLAQNQSKIDDLFDDEASRLSSDAETNTP